MHSRPVLSLVEVLLLFALCCLNKVVLNMVTKQLQKYAFDHKNCFTFCNTESKANTLLNIVLLFVSIFYYFIL